MFGITKIESADNGLAMILTGFTGKRIKVNSLVDVSDRLIGNDTENGRAVIVKLNRYGLDSNGGLGIVYNCLTPGDAFRDYIVVSTGGGGTAWSKVEPADPIHPWTVDTMDSTDDDVCLIVD